MSLIIDHARSFNAVAAGQTATLDLPVTNIYHKLDLLYNESGAAASQANMETDITEVRLFINGVVQRRFNARQLFDINSYHGKPVVAGHLPIYFAEPWRKTAVGGDALAWGMADVDTFHVEVDIVAGATTPDLSVHSVRRVGNLPMAQITKWRQFVVPVGATGIVNLATLPKQDSYYALHCDSDDIDDVEVKVDGRQVLKAPVGVLHEVAKDFGYVPHADWTHIDFSPTRRVSDVLAMGRDGETGRVKDFQVDFNMNAATGFTLLAEVLGQRD